MKVGLEHISTDVLVLGGGLAGYRAALAARKSGADVVLAYRARGASPYVTGFNVPLGHADARDTPEVYFEDMVAGGYGLNDRRLVRALADESIVAFQDLQEAGVKFAQANESCTGAPKFLQRHLSGNTYPRSVYIPAGTGRGILSALSALAQSTGIRALVGYKAFSLLRDGPEVAGALLWKQRSNELLSVRARAVVVAMGGIGQIYSDSTYPADVSADAVALALEAGARLIDMEFVQFEPVVTVWPEQCRGMEMPTAMFGDGVHLRNANQERFMLRYNPPAAELGVEKAKMALLIQKEIDEGRALPPGGVIFDTTIMERGRLEGYVTHLSRLRAAGIDPLVDPPIVAPAAHSIMGGVAIDADGWSGVPGLFVGGEAAGGVHGASRIAGNGSTDTIVLGGIAGRGAAHGMNTRTSRKWTEIESEAVARMAVIRAGHIYDSRVKSDIRRILSECAGLYRTRDGLIAGIERARDISGRLAEAGVSDVTQAALVVELKRMALIAEVILRAALLRTESRGAHQRVDYPETDDARWLCHTSLRMGSDHELVEEISAID